MSTSASPEFADLLARRFPGLTPPQLSALDRHYRLLARWNRVINLTAVRKLEDIIEIHYCECLFLGSHLPPGVLRVADVGSGAGFPGVPVAILRPECQVSLIESHRRKAVFLREATRDLPNVRVLAARAEDVPERFDWVISRAVRVEEIADPLRALAPDRALLTSDPSPAGGFRWEPAVAVPWNPLHFLIVSRETENECFT